MDKVYNRIVSEIQGSKNMFVELPLVLLEDELENIYFTFYNTIIIRRKLRDIYEEKYEVLICK